MQTVGPGLRSKSHSTHNARISRSLRESSATRKLSINGVVGSLVRIASDSDVIRASRKLANRPITVGNRRYHQLSRITSSVR